MNSPNADRHRVVLTTERLLIREIEPGDREALDAIASDPQVNRFMHMETWETPEGRKRWFEWVIGNQATREGGNYNWGIVVKSSMLLIGWLGIGDSDRREREGDRSMGYMVSPDHWGHGYMTEALRAVLDYELGTLNVLRVTANCETENVASARVMEKAGMSFVATVYDADPLEGNYAERHHYALDKVQYERKRN